MILSVFSR